MVDVTTSEVIASQPSANDTALALPALPSRQERRKHVAALREQIESGEYRIPASDLADAILRNAQRAN